MKRSVLLDPSNLKARFQLAYMMDKHLQRLLEKNELYVKMKRAEQGAELAKKIY